MKKSILLTMALATIVFTTTVYSNNKSADEIILHSRYNNDMVSFVEKGVEFYVFLNGDFDFNTNTYHYRYERPRFHIDYNYNGQVRRIGNIRIKYDRRGNVKRIGNVRIKYKYGQLIRVGKLKVKYNRWGEPRFIGRVNRTSERYFKDDYFFGDDFYDDDDCDIDISVDFNNSTIFDYDDRYFYRKSFRNNYRKLKEDNHFYYYKARPNTKVGKKYRVIKRKKIAVAHEPYKYKKRRKIVKKQPSRRSETIMVR